MNTIYYTNRRTGQHLKIKIKQPSYAALQRGKGPTRAQADKIAYSKGFVRCHYPAKLRNYMR